MYRFANIHLSYTQEPILSAATIELSPTQVTLLQGQNGAGKSTLLKVIAGLLRPDSAQIHLNRQQGNWQKMQKQLRTSVCYLHQSPYMFRGDVVRNLRIVAPDKSTDELNQALALVDIAHLKHQPAHTLSGGERQRLAIARAWLHQPDILIFDEPFSNMDSQMVQHTLTLIQTFKHNHKAILVCSHTLYNLHQICEQSLILKDGHVQQL